MVQLTKGFLTLLLAFSASLAAANDTPSDDRENAREVAPAEASGGVAAVNAETLDPGDLEKAGDGAEDRLTVYVPPQLGAPKTRVGGGTRSGGTGLELALLAPEHTGVTAQASPTLYWWVSQGLTGEVEFVVTRRSAIEPDFRVRRTLTVAPGIHALDLQAEGFALEAGEIYQWSVSIIRDPERRSRDMVGVATLEFVPTPTRQTEAPALAAEGLWYDAVAALNCTAGSAPSRSIKADLLEQVALTNVANWVLDGS